jgi:hypothetical protein
MTHSELSGFGQLSTEELEILFFRSVWPEERQVIYEELWRRYGQEFGEQMVRTAGGYQRPRAESLRREYTEGPQVPSEPTSALGYGGWEQQGHGPQPPLAYPHNPRQTYSQYQTGTNLLRKVLLVIGFLVFLYILAGFLGL